MTPAMYLKAIGGGIAAMIGALITAGFFTGSAAVLAGAFCTGLLAFTTVFKIPNKPMESEPNTTPAIPITSATISDSAITGGKITDGAITGGTFGERIDPR